ncbi:hypothetical protein POTOM_021610 [Populus tomentosa]|uniref:Uncharacterized protein n=1 Tax=Populus tomentosa TaxID=118781 RepID=A0A8X7ZXR6_POPTO|nr:hypothetical protein POTOM_021610 [Populus tomentosa]
MGRWFNWWDVMISVSAIDLSRLLQLLLSSFGAQNMIVGFCADCSGNLSLREFLGNIRTVCVGVGMDKVAEKLKAENGLVATGPAEQRVLASSSEVGKCSEGKDGGRMNLRKLVKVVLGEEKDVSKA